MEYESFSDIFVFMVCNSGTPVYAVWSSCPPKDQPSFIKVMQLLHGPSMFVVRAKIYGVLYKQSSCIAFDETSSYWTAPISS